MRGILAGMAAALTVLFSDEAMKAASGAAELFTRGVTPALFPMLVLASLMPEGSGSFWSTFGFSLLAGSPASSRRASGLCLAGRAVSTSALYGACGVMSPMFFTGTLAAWTGSKGAAWIMLISHWLGAVTAGLIGLAADRQKNGNAARSKTPHIESASRKPLIRILPEALKSSAQALLAVCAAMMLFSIIAALIRIPLGRILESKQIPAVIWAFLEIGGGSAELIKQGAALPLVCAMCGFGGLSLWTQNLLFTGDTISPSRLLGLRAVHALTSFFICSAIMAILRLPS